MMDKTFDAARVEDRIYRQWVESGAFAAGSRDGTPYTIVMPPPNVTGNLHIGHALNNTLQDVLVRFARMRGHDVLWQPGSDHAGIATQMVVERQLAKEGRTRQELGREAFVARIWEWKAGSGGAINRQLRRLGASCDWDRERFTLDAGLSQAVTRAFVTLFREGLIYKDRRLVNWDPELQTAISDLEVVPRETDGHLWHLRYDLEDGGTIVVATTRPETMLGDTAIAVHPDDDRYAGLVGRHAILPLVGRRLPVVADLHADPEQGSGAVKITPAHDFNDFEVARRHDLEMIDIFDDRACLNDRVPAAYRGLARRVARQRVLADLEAAGRIARVDSHRHVLPVSDRSGAPIEPRLTMQWYADAKTLAAPAIAAVESGRTRFVPENWTATWYEWMRNIQPWCISRQLWWGHRIPAWYGPDGQVFVATDAAAAARAAEARYGAPTPLTRDPDVLDTWFSSALWPFSTLGWPDDTPALQRRYPTDILVTGFDIVFFWVARMMMFGLHFMKEVPFRTVCLHALVRDEQGRKLSKSKGITIEPLELIDEYGADALRFTLVAMAAMGRDIRLSNRRVAGYRNFATKLWNAARFCEMNRCQPVPGFEPAALDGQINRWIAGEAAKASREVTAALQACKFDRAAAAVYRFVWHHYCDWYLELIKPVLAGKDGDSSAARAECRATAAWVMQQALRLLHPVMPFVTEALWPGFAPPDQPALIAATWPDADAMPEDAGAARDMAWIIGLIGDIRAVRSTLNVPPAARLPLWLNQATAVAHQRLHDYGPQLDHMARVSSQGSASPDTASHDTAAHDTGRPVPDGAVQLAVDGATAILPLAGVIDIAQEQARLGREIDRLDGEIGKLEQKLANQAFRRKAPEQVVAEQERRLAQAMAERDRVQAALARVQCPGPVSGLT